MGTYILGFGENMLQPCTACGKDFKTTYRVQAMNRFIKNPYGQKCEPCARVELLEQHPGTEKQLDEALPKETAHIRAHFTREGRNV